MLCCPSQAYKVTDKACDLPIDLNLVKSHLKIPLSSSAEDFYLNTAIRAVTEFVERTTNLNLLTTTYELLMDDFCESIEIKRRPNAQVTTIEYIEDGSFVTINASNYYVTFSEFFSTIEKVDGFDWPEPDDRKQAVKITFTTGYGTCFDSVPIDLKQAMLQHIADMYMNRGDCNECDCEKGMSAPIKRVYDSYKMTFVGC